MQALTKFKQNSIVAKLLAFQRTPWHIGVVAILVLLSHLTACELLFFWTIILMAAFILVMHEDTTPFMPIVLLAYFSISRKHGAVGWEDVGVWTTTPYIANLACLGVVLVAALVFHLVYYKQYKNFKKRTFLTAGLAAMAATFVLNGLFAPEYTVKNLGLGLSFAFLYYGFYLFVFHTITWKKGYSMRYLAFGMFAMGAVIAAELGVLYIVEPALRATGDKNMVLLGWGISNSIAFIFLLTMPFGFYLTYKERWSLPYFLGTTAMLIAVIFTYARASLIVAVPLYVAGSIFVCLFARKRLPLWITVGVCLIAGIVIVVRYYDRLLQMLNFYINTGLNDRGRFRLWKASIEAFLTAPVFGAGLYYHYGVDLESFFWSHNTLLQFLATCGILGITAYLFHRAQTVYMFLKKPTIERLAAGIAVLCLLVNSMLDIAMSCQNMILYYGIILAFAEKDFLCSTGEIDENGLPVAVPPPPETPRDSLAKARVLFPLVDIGAAYRLPLERVAAVFQHKYGDKVDVTVLPFFQGDAALESMEKSLAHTVELQNNLFGYRRLRLLSAFVFRQNACRDTAQSLVPESYPRALERMAAADADLVFSTHWITAYYAAQAGQAINIEYCADARLDGLWESGAHTVLVPSEQAVGKGQSAHNRKYVPLIIGECGGWFTDVVALRAAWQLIDAPVVSVDGKCGNKAVRAVEALLRSGKALNIVVVCEPNGTVDKKVRAFSIPQHVRLLTVADEAELMPLVDATIGRASGNLYCAPFVVISYGKPTEREWARYCVEEVGCAVREADPEKAARKAVELIGSKEGKRMRLNVRAIADANGAEVVADYLYECLTEKFVCEENGIIRREKKLKGA